MTASRIAGASIWEQEMYDHLRTHGKVEEAILNEYQRLVDDEQSSPAFRYLARMILEDETRHHKLFGDLAESLQQMGELRSEDEPIPPVRGLRADRDRIIQTTAELLAIERSDAKELKALAKEFKKFDKATLWGLLIEVMRDDTAKHIKILRFIQDRAQDRST